MGGVRRSPRRIWHIEGRTPFVRTPAEPCENRDVHWLVSRPWWVLAGAFVLLLAIWLFSPAIRDIPVAAMLFLLLMSIPVSFMTRHRSAHPRSPS
jgi:hypothetical protein